jgi:hypothetical protein
MTIFWTLNSSAAENQKLKCLNKKEVSTIAQTIKDKELLQLDLETSELALDACLRKSCDVAWYQDEASIIGISTATFLLGIFLGFGRVK